VTGLVALHGGGEYVAGDEPAMDALLAAALEAAGGSDEATRIVIVPVAAARSRPDLAAAHGERAFRAAAAARGVPVEVSVAAVLNRASAADPANAALLERAHLVHLPGGDPDLVPSVLRDTQAWAAILRAHGGGACVAGASAGAMALAGRLWTRDGAMAGLGLVPGVAVVPHSRPRRLATWRAAVDPDRRLTWVGLDERTLVIGRPGEAWLVAGAGRVTVAAPDGLSIVARAGDRVAIG
jgi:cyanophycinase-like exopeptidase